LLARDTCLVKDEQIMQNKKLILGMGILVLFVGGAAFIAGRTLNRGGSPLGLFEIIGNGFSMVTDILPAEELPKTPPEAEGLFVERQDNIIFIETGQPGGDGAAGSPVGMGGGPKVEVVITTETILYHDTTQPPAQRPTRDHNPPIQQTVEEGMLDDLYPSQSLVMVWGRKSGERIIAEILVYSDLR
jgi:hypothetical protein